MSYLIMIDCSPCSSEIHSALSCLQGSHHSLVLCKTVSMLTRSLHSSCVFMYWLKFITKKIIRVKQIPGEAAYR
jgi:hypothetical protein